MLFLTLSRVLIAKGDESLTLRGRVVAMRPEKGQEDKTLNETSDSYVFAH